MCVAYGISLLGGSYNMYKSHTSKLEVKQHNVVQAIVVVQYNAHITQIIFYDYFTLLTVLFLGTRGHLLEVTADE